MHRLNTSSMLGKAAVLAAAYAMLLVIFIIDGFN